MTDMAFFAAKTAMENIAGPPRRWGDPIKRMYALVENATGLKPRTLRAIRREEFLSKRAAKILAKVSISLAVSLQEGSEADRARARILRAQAQSLLSLVEG